MSQYNNAKRVVDYYLNRLQEDKENPQAVFTMQSAQLKLTKYHTQCMLDGLTSYDIEMEV